MGLLGSNRRTLSTLIPNGKSQAKPSKSQKQRNQAPSSELALQAATLTFKNASSQQANEVPIAKPQPQSHQKSSSYSVSPKTRSSVPIPRKSPTRVPIKDPELSLDNLYLNDDNNDDEWADRSFNQRRAYAPDYSPEFSPSTVSLQAANIASRAAASQSSDIFIPPSTVHKGYPSSPSTSIASSGSWDSVPAHYPVNDSSYYAASSSPYVYSAGYSSEEFDGARKAANKKLSVTSSIDPMGKSPIIPSKKLDPDTSLVHPESQCNGIVTPKVSVTKSKPSRKPPPISPPSATNTDITSRPSTSIDQRRGTSPRRELSPRRKRPPGLIIEDNEDATVSSPALLEDQSSSTLYSEDSDEVLPQYPLSKDEDYLRTKHKHHTFRKNAKHMLKKGLKASIVTPSSYLIDGQDRRFHGQRKYSHEPIGENQQRPVQFKTTMRKEKKAKSKFDEDKPWKHHNDLGYITEQERKRYESIWAANKGLYMDLVNPDTLNQEVPLPDQQNDALKASLLSTQGSFSQLEKSLILNTVVRDLWGRSRLPKDTLRQIWELVDNRHDGTLDRVSFVVGMWLVDQCLYGRKLPKQVERAVWNSARQFNITVLLK